MLTYEGEESLAKILWQGDNTIVPAGGNFYVGLCNQVPSKSDLLTDITTESTAGVGGYARIAIARNTTDFPDPASWQVDGETRILSIIKTFTASGADFSAPFTRLFLCNVASGTSGVLFGYTGDYSSAIQLVNGQSQNIFFEFYP